MVSIRRAIKGILVLAIAFSCAIVPCFEIETAEAATHISTPGSSPSQPSQDYGAATRQGRVVVPDEDEASGGDKFGINNIITIVLGIFLIGGSIWYVLRFIGNLLLAVASWISRFLSFDD